MKCFITLMLLFVIVLSGCQQELPRPMSIHSPGENSYITAGFINLNQPIYASVVGIMGAQQLNQSRNKDVDYRTLDDDVNALIPIIKSSIENRASKQKDTSDTVPKSDQNDIPAKNPKLQMIGFTTGFSLIVLVGVGIELIRKKNIKKIEVVLKIPNFLK